MGAPEHTVNMMSECRHFDLFRQNKVRLHINVIITAKGGFDVFLTLVLFHLSIKCVRCSSTYTLLAPALENPRQ